MEEQIEFKVGDQVEVVNDAYMPGNDEGPLIKNGNKYPVKGMFMCTCGELHIDIGLISHLNYVTCYKCREELPNSKFGGKHWTHSSRFAITQKSEISEEIQKTSIY
jgi:hypothetical protein